jgi:hypothetical protein
MQERLEQRDRQMIALQRQVSDYQIAIQKMAQALVRVEAEVRRLVSTEPKALKYSLLSSDLR